MSTKWNITQALKMGFKKIKNVTNALILQKFKETRGNTNMY